METVPPAADPTNDDVAPISAATQFDPARGARRKVEDARYEPAPYAPEAAPNYPGAWAARPVPAPIDEAEADLFDRARFSASEVQGDEDFNASRLARARAGFLMLALMVVIGLSLLAGATFWLVAAHPHMSGVTPSVVGWVLGLTGIGLLASSIYLLLERIGARDDAG